jgi:4-deoxy-L-threo-5-hexosulose-uronate ketol-isomerase
MKVIQAISAKDFKNYTTEKVRNNFLIDDLMQEDKISFTYTHYDRMMVGGVRPRNQTVTLETYPNLRSDYFLERRELGVINVGGAAVVSVDGKDYELNKLDCLYAGKGVQKVSFRSADANAPACLYLLSAPAHAVYPVTLLKKEQTESNSLGSADTSNSRTIYRYIHKNGIQSCQLVMGLTLLDTGSVWNTIPAHTHDRRMEVYFYFDVPQEQVVFHYLGEPTETRHIIVSNHGAVLSPPWSIHAGSGTSNYGFIWGMAGENLEYGDMDPVKLSELR